MVSFTVVILNAALAVLSDKGQYVSVCVCVCVCVLEIILKKLVLKLCAERITIHFCTNLYFCCFVYFQFMFRVCCIW